MNRLFILILILLSSTLYGQKPISGYSLTDKKALQIPDIKTTNTQDIADYITANFITSAEKVRAIFIWTASNIQYDVNNMFAIDFYETREAKIDKALKTKKGICENYAAIFNDICTKAGIESYVIEGFTKQNGFTDYIPHAWCAALIDTSWFIFDPTWGSGYISNHNFVKKINNDYFMAQPAVMIKSHMPFDPMWQFLYHPVTVQQYYNGTIVTGVKNNPFFNYRDSINTYNKLSETDRLCATARRTEQNGVSNSMIFDRLAHIKRDLEIHDQNEKINAQNEVVTTYNSALADYNNAVNDLNAFIDYRNKQFTPKNSDEAIQNMIDITDAKVKNAQAKIALIKHPDQNTATLIISFKQSLNDLAAHVDEQKEFLTKYFSKGAFGRKTMFQKYTWMGIPLN